MNKLLSLLPKIRIRSLKLLIPACGILGLIFQLLITVTGLDEKGLMVPWHPAWIGLWLVSIAAALILVAGVLPIRGPSAYQASFPRSVWGCAGGVLAAVSALLAAFSHFRSADYHAGFLASVILFLQGALMFLAAAAFLLAGLCRLLRRKVPFLLHVVICVWFALQMLDFYRSWSFDPQLRDYMFQLFACICLTMTAYQLACFDLGRGSHRKLWAWGLAAVYLCCLSAADHLFFVTGGVWAFANLSNLRRPRQRKPAEAETPTAAE